MKISVSTWSLNNYGFERPEQLVDFAAENGIEALDLTLDDYERYFPWRDKSVAEVEKHFSALGKYAAGKGVEIFQTHAPYALFPDYIGEKFLETTRKALIATRAAGAEYCVCHPLVFPLYGKRDLWKEELDYNLGFFARTDDLLETLNVTICLENIFDWDKGEIRKVFVSEILGLNEYLSRLDERRYGACLDTGHLHLFGGNVCDAAETLGKRLKVLHLHDNDGVKDRHVLPLMGTVDWRGFKATLQKIGYAGTLNLELKPLPYTAATHRFWLYAADLMRKTD